MINDKDNEKVPTKRTSYPDELHYKCPVCKQDVHFSFTSSKHDYQDFQGMIRQYRNQYCCDNPACVLYRTYFNPAPLDVLPGKRFSLDVWKWIAKEAKIRHQKVSQIMERLRDEFGVKISESTVRSYIDEVDVFVAGKIDEKTAMLIKAQGHILLSFDGQEPDGDGPSLWMFVDVISNRVLRIVVLDSADHETLHDQVELILTQYGVTLAGMISDKQGSIVKMHDVYYPTIPHQYCHFHYLQNLWNHIEVKDSHVHKTLAKAVNHLYITTVSKKVTKTIEGVGKVPIRKTYEKIESDVRKLLKGSTKKFEKLRGHETWMKLAKYTEDIEATCKSENQDQWTVKTLLKTAANIKEALEQTAADHDDCVDLERRFQEIRSTLGSPSILRQEKINILDALHDQIWNEYSKLEGISERENLRTFLPSYSKRKSQILLEWVRLYSSYKRGLFAYYEFPVLERSNADMEAHFGQEKMVLYSRCGKNQVAPQVRVRGEYILKEIYAGKDEVIDIISTVSKDYDVSQIRAGLEALNLRVAEESDNWRSNIEGINAIKQVIEIGKQKKNEENGEDNLDSDGINT
jgi:hypothetical protein